MPTLDWIGKEAVLADRINLPRPRLRRREDLSVGAPDSGNLVIQGDNLLALKALLPYYRAKVRCVYIDPPYNTGKTWYYNDSADGPEIREWLGKVVGDGAKSLSRRDKWLCMMLPRLSLLREFLAEDGAIFISIDDNELASLRLLMDEIFGGENFVGILTWHKRAAPLKDAQYFSLDHEYILVYARERALWRPKGGPLGSVLGFPEHGNTVEAREELWAMVDEPRFDTPKPVKLIRRILDIATDKDSLILDAFAGSGTTGHAALELNGADGGRRRFVLVETDEKACRKVIASRLSQVMEKDAKAPGFKYCTLY